MILSFVVAKINTTNLIGCDPEVKFLIYKQAFSQQNPKKLNLLKGKSNIVVNPSSSKLGDN